MSVNWDEVWSRVLLWMPQLFASTLILIAFWFGGLVIKKVMRHFGEKDRVDKDVMTLLEQIVSNGLMVFGLVTALGTLGINVSALVAGLGLTGFALGFALRDSLSNLVSGVMILVYRPFRRGDKISVTGFEGSVTAIDLRYTTLDTEGKRYLIPNSVLFNNPITILRNL